MAKLRLTESLDFGTRQKHDPEKGVVYGVKVLGLGSRNGREYTKAAVREAYTRKLYHDQSVYLNHPAGKSNARDIRDRFARLREVRVDDHGELYADLHYIPTHAYAPTFRHLVDNDPHGIGLSQNAEGTGKKRPGKTTLVESIDVVHSVDLVDGPATTMGLFEQDTSMNDMGGADPAAAPVESTGGDWRMQVAELAKTLVADEGMSAEDIKGKLTQLLKLIDEETGGSGDGEKAEGDELPAEPETDDEMMEQLRTFASPSVRKAVRKLDEIRIREQARKAGLADAAITPAFLKTLIREATDPKAVAELIADRKAVAKSEPKPGAKKPTSAGREPVKLDEQAAGGETPKKSTKELAAHYFGAIPEGETPDW